MAVQVATGVANISTSTELARVQWSLVRYKKTNNNNGMINKRKKLISYALVSLYNSFNEVSPNCAPTRNIAIAVVAFDKYPIGLVINWGMDICKQNISNPTITLIKPGDKNDLIFILRLDENDD